MSFEDASFNSPRPSRRAREAPRRARTDFSSKPGVETIQLSRNESAMPLPPGWMEAAAKAASSAARYPDPECTLLRQSIAKNFRLDHQKIVCTAGLLEGLHTIALAYLDSGDKVLIPEHAFGFFQQVAQLAGAKVQLVPERNLHVDICNILACADESTRMVIFANPGNPTGTYLCKQRILELCRNLPSTTLLVIDEAYAEFVCEDRYQPLFDLTDSGHVIILRSFSKMYGLAGFRVGWAYCPQAVAEHLRRIQIPAIVGSVAQAIATAAVQDQGPVHSFKREMCLIRRRFVDRLKRQDRIAPVESETNFVLFQTKSEAEAQNLDAFLRHRGIILRSTAEVGLSHCLRATIGTEDQMQFVASTILAWCNEEEA